MDGDFLDAVFRTQSCLLYHFVSWLIRAGMPLRHRRSALRLFGSYRLRGTAGAPWRRRLLCLCIKKQIVIRGEDMKKNILILFFILMGLNIFSKEKRYNT
ncbi:MAG: hypothetical protein II631_07875, partial [Treponema sp.]|nr:hypothetical protein [Treponema sp.]